MKKLLYCFIITLLCILSFLTGFFVKKSVDEKLFKHFKTEINNLKDENKFINDLNDKLLNNNNPIPEKEKKCLDKASSTADSLNCSYIAEKEWENEILKSLELLKQSMTEEQYKIIKDNQYLWIKQNKSNNEIINKFIFNHSGTMYYQLAVSDIVELKKQRAEFLNWIYKIHTDKITNS